MEHESTNWGHYIYVSYWSRERHFTLYPKLQEGLAVYKAKPVSSFLSYCTKSLGIGPVPWSNPRPPALELNEVHWELC